MTTTMDTPVRVKLTDEELVEKGLRLANRIAERDALVQQKKDHAKSDQALIDEVDETISALAQELRDREEDRRQGDLFADQTALHDVAARAGEALGNADNGDDGPPVGGEA